MFIYKTKPFINFIYIIIPFILFASDQNEDFSSIKKSEQNTPIIVYNRLIAQLDQLSDKTLKMQNKIKLAKDINQAIVTQLPILSQELTLLSSLVQHPEYNRIVQYINATTSNLEYAAKAYFTHLYEPSIKIENITFFNKSGGDQTGEVMKLKLNDGQQSFDIKYYIKTHQNGSRGGQSSVAEVDPKEIFIYKLLEVLKVGSKSHFFNSSLSHGGIYIATQDAAFSKQLDKSKYKSFQTFEQYSKEFEQRFNVDLNSQDKLTDIHLKAINMDDVLMKGLAICDLISRIFRLTDVTTNLSNYGFTRYLTQNDNTIKKLKIIDFRVVHESNYSPEGLYQGFLQGNGRFNYVFNKIIGYVLKERSTEDREEIAKHIIAHWNENNFLENSITQGLDFTQEFCSQNTMFNQKNTKEDLKKYAKECFENFLEFKQGLLKN